MTSASKQTDSRKIPKGGSGTAKPTYVPAGVMMAERILEQIDRIRAQAAAAMSSGFNVEIGQSRDCVRDYEAEWQHADGWQYHKLEGPLIVTIKIHDEKG